MTSSLLDLANLDLGHTAPTAAPPSAAAPTSAIPTRQAARLIAGVHTEVFCQSYSDRILIIITQLGRIGCWLQISPPPPSLPTPLPSSSSTPSIFPHLPAPHPSTALSTLFGVLSPTLQQGILHQLMANQVGGIVFSEGEGRPVWLGLGLKKPSTTEDDEEEGITEEQRQLFGQCMEMVLECRVW